MYTTILETIHAVRSHMITKCLLFPYRGIGVVDCLLKPLNYLLLFLSSKAHFSIRLILDENIQYVGKASGRCSAWDCSELSSTSAILSL